jgi:hypothetical protein
LGGSGLQRPSGEGVGRKNPNSAEASHGMASQGRTDREKRFEDWAANVSQSFHNVKLRLDDGLVEELKARKIENKTLGEDRVTKTL